MFTDEKTGKVIYSQLVQEARREEVGFMKRIPLYDEVPESWERTGNAPISTNFVDLMKGGIAR